MNKRQNTIWQAQEQETKTQTYFFFWHKVWKTQETRTRTQITKHKTQTRTKQDVNKNTNNRIRTKTQTWTEYKEKDLDRIKPVSRAEALILDDVNLTGWNIWYRLWSFGWRHFQWRKKSQDRRHKDYLDKSEIGSTRNPERSSHQILSNAKSPFIENKN